MSEGEISAEYQIPDNDTGFIFEKKGQRDVNSDWKEWIDTGIHLTQLEILYPQSGGPGGKFTIVGSHTLIIDRAAGVFHWRCRKLSGWQRDAYRFLYKDRLVSAIGKCWSNTA